MQKWEYLKLDIQYRSGNIHSWDIDGGHVNGASLMITDINSLREYLNRLGNEGWELVTVIATGKGEGYTFKRPIE